MLEVKNLVKKFDKNIAVNNISFNVTEGRIFGLLGRNGAGKSTIFRTILNIFKVKSIVTFAAVSVFVYMAVTKQLEPATTTAIIMLVFQSLFGKPKNSDE